MIPLSSPKAQLARERCWGLEASGPHNIVSCHCHGIATPILLPCTVRMAALAFILDLCFHLVLSSSTRRQWASRLRARLSAAPSPAWLASWWPHSSETAMWGVYQATTFSGWTSNHVYIYLQRHSISSITDTHSPVQGMPQASKLRTRRDKTTWWEILNNSTSDAAFLVFSRATRVLLWATRYLRCLGQRLKNQWSLQKTR